MTDKNLPLSASPVGCLPPAAGRKQPEPLGLPSTSHHFSFITPRGKTIIFVVILQNEWQKMSIEAECGFLFLPVSEVLCGTVLLLSNRFVFYLSLSLSLFPKDGWQRIDLEILKSGKLCASCHTKPSLTSTTGFH